MNAHPRLLTLLGLALALASFSIPYSARAELVRIYVTNSAGDSVHVVDPATNKVVQVFKGPEAMHGIGFAPLRDMARGTGLAAVKLNLDVGLGQRQARRTPVDHAADRRAMGFAEG